MATTIYEAVRDSLVALFKGRWPAFDVFSESIDKTQESGQAELEDYIYLDIIPSGNQPAGRGYTDRSILVDAQSTPRARATGSICRSARRWMSCCSRCSVSRTRETPGR